MSSAHDMLLAWGLLSIAAMSSQPFGRGFAKFRSLRLVDIAFEAAIQAEVTGSGASNTLDALVGVMNCTELGTTSSAGERVDGDKICCGEQWLGVASILGLCELTSAFELEGNDGASEKDSASAGASTCSAMLRTDMTVGNTSGAGCCTASGRSACARQSTEAVLTGESPSCGPSLFGRTICWRVSECPRISGLWNKA